MEKRVLDKIESQIALESNTNLIPGEIEVEEEINKDNNWWEK